VSKIESKYDIVIIGSGMAGLASGLILAREGYKVCILEKDAQIGGTLQTDKRDKMKFDTGVHYVGGLDAGQPLHPYFKYLDILENVQLKKMDMDGYDLISFEGDSNFYPHAQGYENFKNQLLKYFPTEELALDKYISGIQKFCSKFTLYNILDDIEPNNELDYLYVSAKKFIESCTANQLLRNVLGGSNLLYAGEADASPFYIHALVINSYILSSYKFVNGGSEISRSLNYSIKDLGGKIVRNAEVLSINHQNKKAESVTLKDGRVIKAAIFISNIHPTQTIKLMDTSNMRKSYVNRIMNLRNSVSVFTLYIVLKPNTVPFTNQNHYHVSSNDIWNLTEYKDENWGKDFAVFAMPSKDNPNFSGILTVLAYMNFDEVRRWQHTNNTTLDVNDRGAGYEEFKEEKALELIENLEKFMPGTKSNISSYYTSSPLTQRDYLNSVEGSLYGVVRDFNSPLHSQVNTKTKLKNLFLTGQNIIMHGILGTTISAVITCSEIVGRENLVGKIRASVK